MQFHNALVAASATTFVQGSHAIEDLQILSFVLEHKEGDFATLSIEIKNPGTGLLLGQRWLWFSVTPAGSATAVPLFFGRIIGFPSNILGEAITIELIGRPLDYDEQRAALADSLRVLPWYDETLIDEARRSDPDVVLEAYSKLWHIDPVTHEVSVSDIITGEEATITFDETEIFYDDFDIAIAGNPLASVTIEAELNWTQLAQGGLDLSLYIQSNWPNETPGSYITSFTMKEDSWPQNGASIGDNWTVSDGRLRSHYDTTPRNVAGGGKTIVQWPDGDTLEIQAQTSDDYVSSPPGSIPLSRLYLTDTVNVTYGDDGEGNQTITSMSINQSWADGIVALGTFSPTLIVNYNAERPRMERVKITMRADVQELVTMTTEDQSLIVDGIRSVNLSDPINDDSIPYIPIQDPRRRTYILTNRGEQTLLHLLLIGRAHLLRRARAIEITFGTTLDRLFDLSLKKNATLTDPRLPGGTASGKIIAWQFSLDGDRGEPKITVTLGSAIGTGGTLTPAAGTPTYAENGYVEDDYQEAEGQLNVFNSESGYADLGYEVPTFNPNDDGINFIRGLTVETAIEQELAVENPPATQRASVAAAVGMWGGSHLIDNLTPEQRQEISARRSEAINSALRDVPTVATFKLRSMRKKFESEYRITARPLKVPQHIDLSAA